MASQLIQRHGCILCTNLHFDKYWINELKDDETSYEDHVKREHPGEANWALMWTSWTRKVFPDGRMVDTQEEYDPASEIERRHGHTDLCDLERDDMRTPTQATFNLNSQDLTPDLHYTCDNLYAMQSASNQQLPSPTFERITYDANTQVFDTEPQSAARSYPLIKANLPPEPAPIHIPVISSQLPASLPSQSWSQLFATPNEGVWTHWYYIPSVDRRAMQGAYGPEIMQSARNVFESREPRPVDVVRYLHSRSLRVIAELEMVKTQLSAAREMQNQEY